MIGSYRIGIISSFLCRHGTVGGCYISIINIARIVGLIMVSPNTVSPGIRQSGHIVSYRRLLLLNIFGH